MEKTVSEKIDAGMTVTVSEVVAAIESGELDVITWDEG